MFGGRLCGPKVQGPHAHRLANRRVPREPFIFAADRYLEIVAPPFCPPETMEKLIIGNILDAIYEGSATFWHFKSRSKWPIGITGRLKF